jgi:hypothetical protein
MTSVYYPARPFSLMIISAGGGSPRCPAPAGG